MNRLILMKMIGRTKAGIWGNVKTERIKERTKEGIKQNSNKSNKFDKY